MIKVILIRTDMFMIIIWKSIYKTCKNKTASLNHNLPTICG